MPNKKKEAEQYKVIICTKELNQRNAPGELWFKCVLPKSVYISKKKYNVKKNPDSRPIFLNHLLNFS